MQMFQATLLNEIEKIVKRKKAIAAVVLSIVAIILGQLGVFAARYGLGLRTATGTGFPILILSFSLSTLLPLFAALGAIDAFTGEFSRNTMKLTITRPVTRFKIYSAKICAISIFIGMILAFVMVLSLLSGLIFNPDFSYIVGVLKVFTAYISSLVPLIVWIILVAFIANIMKSSTGAFFLVIVVFLVFKIISVIFPPLSGLLPISSLDWYKLWTSFPPPAARIISKTLLMGAYGLIFYTAGYYIFLRRDL